MDVLQKIAVISLMDPLTAAFLIGFTTIVLFLWYSSRKLNYWKKKGVPFVKSYPIVGSMLDFMTKPVHEAEIDRYRKLGRIYGYFEGNQAHLAVGIPEILRAILVKDFHLFTERRKVETGNTITDRMLPMLQGEDWKRVRTIITPTFTTGKIKRVMGIFKECSNTLVRNFKEAAEKEKFIDIKRFYGAFTMDTIASSAFSTKIDSHNDPDNKFVVTVRDVFPRKINWRLVMLGLCPSILKLFGIPIFDAKGLHFFTDVTLQIIEERKKTGQTRNDFLQLLLDTAKEVNEEESKEKDDIAENYHKVEDNVVFKNVISKRSLSLDELVAQCVIFFLAGYDTTASTMTFATYNLALNPEVQEKLIQEIDDVLRKNNGELSYEAIQDMKYLDNVISETLRLYPPNPRLEREANVDYKLGDTGIIAPKKMIISIPVYAIHRDPEFFPDPEKFDPDRFNSDQRAKRNPYVYLPFGAGPRNCVGMRFALIEIKVCLAYVLSNFRFKKCPQTKVPLDFYTAQALLHPKSVTVEVEVRKDTVKSL